MYSCNNCRSRVPEPNGRCNTCNIRLSPQNVSLLSAEAQPVLERYADDLQVSHRCCNCGTVLKNAGGRCQECRYPIPADQLAVAPQAEIIPLHQYRGDRLRAAN